MQIQGKYEREKAKQGSRTETKVLYIPGTDEKQTRAAAPNKSVVSSFGADQNRTEEPQGIKKNPGDI